MLDIKYPEVQVQLVGEDGNAFAILGRCTREMRRHGLAHEIDAFRAEATSGDYDNLLRTVMLWFTVDAENDEDDDNRCDWCGYFHWECVCDEEDDEDWED